ncbi:MAG: DUF354 domain-containing protein [Planctomycetes bacterium]|nr:DUF354 domain-containing protein [Planctomycetota bacterium]
MRMVVDINHPAHVHFFKHFIRQMQEAGHALMVTASEKDVACDLLRAEGFAYTPLGRYGTSLWGKAVTLPVMDGRMVRAARAFGPDVLLGVASVRAAHAGFLLRRRSVIFDDTEHAKWEVRLYLPFADVVCTPACYRRSLGPKQVRYNGYHELAYLHPSRFRPDPSVLEALGAAEGERLAVVRFVSWGAVHDMGQHGFDPASRRELVASLERHARVLVVAEDALDPALEPYRCPLPPERLHDLLHYAAVYVGEGATMATEAALLGTPSVYLSSLVGTMGNFEELRDDYHLVVATQSKREAIDEAVRLASDPGAKRTWAERRARLLRDKIDVTQWMVDLVERTVPPPEEPAGASNGC